MYLILLFLNELIIDEFALFHRKEEIRNYPAFSYSLDFALSGISLVVAFN